MTEKAIGIIGGMGPEATVDVFAKIVASTPSSKDQDHLRIIIDKCLLTTMQEHSVTCTCAFTQRAGIAALKKSGDFVKNLIAESGKKRDLVVDTLNRIPGISCPSPRGTFYAFSNITRTGKTDEELSMWILDKTGVITLPGSTFGEAGKGYLRVSYAIPWDQLKEGLGKVEEAVKSLPK